MAPQLAQVCTNDWFRFVTWTFLLGSLQPGGVRCRFSNETVLERQADAARLQTAKNLRPIIP